MKAGEWRRERNEFFLFEDKIKYKGKIWKTHVCCCVFVSLPMFCCFSFSVSLSLSLSVSLSLSLSIAGTTISVKYALFQDQSGSWRVSCVSVHEGSFENRLSLPASWRGLRDDKVDRMGEEEVKIARWMS